MKPPFAMSRKKNLVNMWVVLLGKKQETSFGDANFDIPIVIWRRLPWATCVWNSVEI